MVIKANQLIIYKVKVALSSDIHTKHSKLREHHVEYSNAKPGGTERNR